MPSHSRPCDVAEPPALIALLGKAWSDVTEADYTRMLAALKLRPRVIDLQPK